MVDASQIYLNHVEAEGRPIEQNSAAVTPIDPLTPNRRASCSRKSRKRLLKETAKEHLQLLATVPLLIIDDLGMRKLRPTVAKELAEIIMRRYERASTLSTSNRPGEDWGKLLGESAAVTAMLDRLLHQGSFLEEGAYHLDCGASTPASGCVM